MTFPAPDEWTLADADAAWREGWNIWDCSGSLNGRTQLCRYDEENIFGHDMEAWKFVWTKAQEGSALHKKALDVVKKHNPQEFAAIKEWCEA